MEQRYQAVLAVIADGRGVGEVAAQFGVSRQSVHSRLRRYEDHGLEGLANRSHKPKSIPHQMPAHVEATVLELRREHRAWGPRRLVYELLKRGVVPVPSETGVYRALKRAGLIEPGGRRLLERHVEAVGARVCDGVVANGHCRWVRPARWNLRQMPHRCG